MAKLSLRIILHYGRHKCFDSRLSLASCRSSRLGSEPRTVVVQRRNWLAGESACPTRQRSRQPKTIGRARLGWPARGPAADEGVRPTCPANSRARRGFGGLVILGGEANAARSQAGGLRYTKQINCLTLELVPGSILLCEKRSALCQIRIDDEPFEVAGIMPLGFVSPTRRSNCGCRLR